MLRVKSRRATFAVALLALSVVPLALGLAPARAATPVGTITEIPLSTPGGEPNVMTPGPDGNMWFTELNAQLIGRANPAGTVVTANTILLQQLSCYNTTAGAITINRTDTAGNQFEVAFSIPANSNYERQYLAGEKMVGLKLWASAINSINCTLTAKQ